MFSSTTSKKQFLFQQAYYIMLLLAIVNLGTSNLIGSLALQSLDHLQPISLVLIPIYVISAMLIKRESMSAYYAAFLAFTLSSIQSLLLSLVNGELAASAIGLPAFIALTLVNITFIVIIWTVLFRGYSILKRLENEYAFQPASNDID